MGTADFPNILDLVKSWMPRKPEPSNLSKDFWMPDESCRVCYECDSEFTMFNRRHHCRLCGRVFCAKCTSQSVPTPSEETTTLDQEDRERIRVCNYCFKQWEKGRVEIQNEEAGPVSPGGLSPTPSASSFGSTCDSAYYSTGTYEYLSPSSHSSISPQLGTAQLSPLRKSGSSGVLEQIRETATGELSHADSIKFDFQTIRSEDSNNEGSTYQSYSEARQFPQPDNYHGLVGSDEIDKDCEYCQRHTVETTESHEIGATDLEGVEYNGGESSSDIDDCEASLYDIQGSGVDNLDFENYGLLWVPPEPEVEDGDEHETSTILDDDSDGYLNGDWTYSFSSNSSNGKDFHHKEKLVEQPRSGVKNVVSGHFRSLIAQLLKAENLPVDEMNDKESWLDIVTSLSWEAAALLKPDMSGSGGMDPGGYIKVKCLACGLKSDSLLVKGVVCKKNVVHRHMMSKIDKPSILILGGALGYERISNHFSSFDTLLRQEMDHLKMAVAKIDSHHPNVLLVEKSVSRHAQGYLLGKNISLVLNIKRPLLERIARCTGAQIIPSIDHLQSPTLGFCDFFHVETYFEEHGSAGQRGKKLRKTLMFFEGCPKPLGYTILLKGANGDELKKVKHVVQYGVFAAYHLALETSFLADEGASLPELNIKSPVTVVLPDKPSGTDKAIITVRKYSPSSSGKYLENGLLHGCSNSDDGWSSVFSPMDHSSEQTKLTITSLSNLPPARQYTDCAAVPERVTGGNITPTGRDEEDMLFGPFSLSEPLKHDSCNWHPNGTSVTKHGQCTSDNIMSEEESFPENNGQKLGKETLPAPASNHQSILVSLTTRCDWKGVMCEKARLFRITYYGSFDKPLGRFLHDDLFEQDYQCRACDVPSEGHIYCYTHRQGTLTISVRKLEEFLLPGEREGKIWMWHRCLRCPRVNGFPPATMRVTMSDAAWGLSFGKFLELSFSDHAAASRVASCGHSLHRDCLRFFGCGRMVACFRYAPIAVYNVRLPPSEVQFEYLRQDWIQNDADQVNDIAELLFTEVYNVLNQIAEVVQVGSVDTGIKTCEVRKHVAELEKILKREKEEFEESLIKALNLKAKVDELIDILEINKVRRKLLFLAYAWDQRIICAVSSCKNTQKQVLGDKVIEQPADTPNTEMHDSSETDRQGLNDSDQIDAHGTFSKVSTSHKPKANDEKRNSHQEMDNTGDSEVLPELPVPNPLKSADLVQRSLSDGDTSDRTYMFDNFDKLDLIGEYKPTYIMSYKEIEQQGGARLLLKMGINGTVVPVYDDEPTSAIAYALVSPNYHDQIDDPDSYKNELESSFSLPLLNLENLLLLQSTNDLASESLRSLASADENILSTSGSRGSLLLDPLILSRALHTKVTFTDDGSLGKVKYTVTCYYAKRFEALREICCPSKTDFVRSLSRCKKWGAQGGKSNVFFAKTLDDRFIIKQVTKTELESFIKFAPAYFKYLSESISTGSPTCLAKILGIYKVSSKHLKGGKDFKMDVLVMENLLYRRNVSRVYDLKGSSRARYNPDTSGQNKVLLDQNLLETMSTSPIFVGNKAKRLLERAVWNDTAFLASIDVMDYSLLVGVDEENQELVLGIIDFMRQYTWDKHLEHWVKSSGLLGGPKNASPTVISPMQYKKRFRKAMSSYFLTVPDDWSSVPMACQTGPISEPCEQRSQT